MNSFLFLGPYSMLGVFAGAVGLSAYAQADGDYRIAMPFLVAEGEPVPAWADARLWTPVALAAANRFTNVGDAFGGSVGGVMEVASVASIASFAVSEGIRYGAGMPAFDLLPAPEESAV